MTISVPDQLNDIAALLGGSGFATSNVWYHGTSSALVESIKSSGLLRSGDKELAQAAKNTMATIGNNYTENREPVFLTQSKALAYYWAEECVTRRSVRFDAVEVPAVFQITFPEDVNAKVRPDVGAASLLMVKEGEAFIGWLAKQYQDAGKGELDIDLMHADRMDYLSKLGMAYIDQDIASEMLKNILQAEKRLTA